MYEERQKQWAYEQAHGIEPRCNDPKKPQGNQRQITTTSSPKDTAGGVTSSSSMKYTGNAKGHDMGGC